MVDPLVEVSVHVPDWTHSPFLPNEHNYSPPNTPLGAAAATTATTARTVSYKTGKVKNNGFNPVWEESFSLPFDCVGDMRELVFVKFAVKDDDDKEYTEPLALYCTSLGCLNEGGICPFIHQNHITYGAPQVSGTCHYTTLSYLSIFFRPYLYA
jgi:phosphatidylinositol phospholipase C, delta